MKQLKIPLVSAMLITLLLNSTTRSQNNITKQVLANGANFASNSTLRLQSTMGQTGIGKVAGGSNTLSLGFWQLAEGSAPASMPGHWLFTSSTSANATIIIPISANPNLDGMPLINEDCIGVFTPAGLCCGWERWTGQNFSLTVWGDNDQTPQVDGFRSGEILSFRAFRPSSQTEYMPVDVAYAQGDGKFLVNAIFVLNKFTAGTNSAGTQTITLKFLKGWNLFSANVIPANPSISNLFSSIMSNIEIVKNSSGKSLLPAYGIDQIGSLDCKEGYMAFLKVNSDLSISGRPVVPSNMPITLSQSWSLIGYLPSIPIDATKALATIANKLVIVKDNYGKSYLPEFGINSIGQMQPGQGYWVCLKGADTLIYPASALAKGNDVQTTFTETNTSSQDTTKWFKFRKNTGVNATIVIPLNCNPKYSDGTPLNEGDEIGFFNYKGKKGLCAGAGIWQKQNQAITVWGENTGYDSTAIGFRKHDSLQVRVWKKDGIEYYAHATCRPSDSLFYSENAIIVLTDLVVDLGTPTAVTGQEIVLQPEKFLLLGNYPNPFNPETTIQYELPHAAPVQIIIYDRVGKRTRLLLDQYQSAGRYYLKWNGKNDSGQPVPSGLYLYRLTVEGTMVCKKMILLR